MGKGKRKKRFLNDLQFNQSLLENRLSYLEYYELLEDIGLNCFKWKNLPSSVDERFLEMTLFEKGQAVFFKDDAMEKYLALTVMIGGELNVYRIPTKRNAYATNGYFNKLTDKDSVLIFNNRIHTPSKLQVEIFAQRLYNIDRTIDVNVNGQKTPIAILCDENQRLTMENLYMKYEGNQPFIFGGKELDVKSIQAINTGAPYVSDKLYELKREYWNEALTYLGVANVQTAKKERLITDEVNRSMGGVFASRLSRLNERQEACKKINEMFGLDISVEFNEGIIDTVGDSAGIGDIEDAD